MVKIREKVHDIADGSGWDCDIVIDMDGTRCILYKVPAQDSPLSPKIRTRTLEEGLITRGLAPLSEFLEAKGETYESVANGTRCINEHLPSTEGILSLLKVGWLHTKKDKVLGLDQFPNTSKACAEYLGLEPDDLIGMIKLDQVELPPKTTRIINHKCIRTKIDNNWRPLSEVLDDVGIDWPEMAQKLLAYSHPDKAVCRQGVISSLKEEVSRLQGTGQQFSNSLEVADCAKYLNLSIDDVVNMVEAEREWHEGDSVYTIEGPGVVAQVGEGSSGRYKTFNEADFPKPEYDHHLGKIEIDEPSNSNWADRQKKRKEHIGKIAEALHKPGGIDKIANGLSFPIRPHVDDMAFFKEIGSYRGISIYSTKGDNMYKFNDTKFKAEYRKAQVKHDPDGVLEKAGVMTSDGIFQFKTDLGWKIQAILDREGKPYTVQEIKAVFDEYVTKEEPKKE